MKCQLEEALNTHRDNLALVSRQPQTLETIQIKKEIEDAIKSTLEVLDEMDTHEDGEKESTNGITTDSQSTIKSVGFSRKRKHVQAKNSPMQQSFTEIMDCPINLPMLSEKYPDFAPYAFKSRNGSWSMEFSDPKATLALTKVLLKEYYDLEWDIPLGQLVPAVPCRVKYLTWINDLLHLLDTKRLPVVGLDVGCGANCIYSLLGATMYGWQFVGTDVTDVAIDSARYNINRNPKVRSLIDVVRVDGDILSDVVSSHGPFHFSICNPPFFLSMAEAGRNEKTAFGGTETEMVYPAPDLGWMTVFQGGELAFVGKMVDESVFLKEKICWFSAMLGKKSTLKAIRSSLHSLNVPALRTTTFQQGKMTRWAIAWSFVAKNTNHKPLIPMHRPSCVSDRSIQTLPNYGKDAKALIAFIERTVEVHAEWTIRGRCETGLRLAPTGDSSTNAAISIDVTTNGHHQFQVRFCGKEVCIQEFLTKIWGDVQIMWSA